MKIAEFESQENGFYRYRVKNLFLYKLGEKLPQIKEELKQQPYNLMLKADFSNKIVRNLFNNWIFGFLKIDRPNLSSLPSVELAESMQVFQIINSIYQITDKYNLSNDWIIRQFGNLIKFWQNGVGLNDVGLDGGFARYAPQDKRIRKPFTFEFESYELTMEAKSSYKENIHKAFNLQLESYLSALESIAQDLGYQRNEQPRELEKHIVWFITWQTDSTKTYSDIADLETSENSIGEDTISKAINKIAYLAEIEKRSVFRRWQTNLN